MAPHSMDPSGRCQPRPPLGLQRRRDATTLPRSVKPDLSQFRERLDSIRARIGAAAARAGRSGEPVTLIAVTKTVPADVVAGAVAAGVVDLGENRVQEAESKVALEGLAGVRWHLIGHLQSNKVARAVALFDRVHSVDTVALAEALARRAAAAGRRLAVMIEVNVSREATKFGVSPEGLGELAERIAPLEGLAFDGLMTVGPLVERPEDARAGFARLRELRDELARRLGRPLPQLSMGMSGDFEVAVEEGSTMVRVGTALFGSRGRVR
jgi:PLP dependent protein